MVPGAAGLLRRHGQLQMPIMILAGTGDRIVATRQQSARLHPELPQSEFRAIEGAGHMIEHTAPEEVADAIRWALQFQSRDDRQNLTRAQAPA